MMIEVLSERAEVTFFAVAQDKLEVEAAISALKKMEDDWNNHNLDGFLEGYWQNKSFRFLSGNRRRFGIAEAEEYYTESYSTPEALGNVEFSNIETSKLSGGEVLLSCRWGLSFSNDEVVTGLATFIFMEINGEWTVIYEHASH